jgi:hypothetical protein
MSGSFQAVRDKAAYYTVHWHLGAKISDLTDGS